MQVSEYTGSSKVGLRMAHYTSYYPNDVRLSEGAWQHKPNSAQRISF
jgi:hypothetical protein